MKKKMLKLSAFTPEGRIVRALSNGKNSFSELVKATGLSERWLSIKLKQLLQLDVVKLSSNGYHVDHERLHALLAPSLKETAWIAAYEVVEKHPQVLSVLLYGSISKGKVHEESDVDLLVISENPLDLIDDEYEISMTYEVALEINSVSLTEFLAMLHFKSALLFGVLEGYDVLFDRAGITTLLKVFKKDIHKNWQYNKDEGLWLKLKK